MITSSENENLYDSIPVLIIRPKQKNLLILNILQTLPY